MLDTVGGGQSSIPPSRSCCTIVPTVGGAVCAVAM